LEQHFQFIIRLEINDIEFLDEPSSDRLIVHQKPVYIENEPSLNMLFKAKFIQQQRFELEKSILA
jgi:hypothetical protein